jgi:hypothetical protein
MEITISRGERTYGPYSEDQVRDMLRTGSVVAHDVARCEPDGKWTTVDQILGLLVQPPHSPPEPIAVTAADLVNQQPAVKVWNPNHAASLSVISLGIIGPLVHAHNWGALNRPEEKRKAGKWAIVFVVCYAAMVLFGDQLQHADGSSPLTLVAIGLTIAWYFGHGRSQARYLKSLPPGTVAMKPTKPLLIASLAVLGVLLAVSMFPLGALAGKTPGGLTAESTERAERATRTLVQKNLKSPASARFSDFRVMDSSGPYFQTMITVDSQNGFGAMIRNDAVVAFKLIEDGEFEFNQMTAVLFIEPNSFLKRGEFTLMQEETIAMQKRMLKWPGLADETSDKAPD